MKMGKQVRINGIDFLKSTRLDKTRRKKKMKGSRSNSFAQSLKQKNKFELIVENSKSLIYNMFQNPTMYDAQIIGEDDVEPNQIEQLRYKQSIGDIDFTTVESIKLKNHAIKNSEDIINRDDWEWIIDEDFDTDANWVVGAMATHISSGGAGLQTRTLDWHEAFGSADISTTEKIEGDQSLKLTASIVRCQLSKLYSNYELSHYIFANNASGIARTLIGLRGYDGSMTTYPIVFDFANNTVTINTTVVKSESYTLTENVWIFIKILVIGNKVSVYIDNNFVLETTNSFSGHGDIGFYENGTGEVYIDKVRMRVQPHSIISSPSLTNNREVQSVNSSIGSQELIYNEKQSDIPLHPSIDSQLLLKMDERKGNILTDKSSNTNNGTIRNGSWTEDGLLGHAIDLSNGDIIVVDDSSISDFAEVRVHTRFRINSFENATKTILGKSDEWVVYNEYDSGNHYIQFEMFGLTLRGDEIFENTWYEFWFLSDGKSLFIFHRDLDNQVIVAEARLPLGDVSGWSTTATETGLYINSRDDGDYGDITFDYLDLQDKFYMPYLHEESLLQVRAWKLPYDDLGNFDQKSLISYMPFLEGSGDYSKTRNIYSSNMYLSGMINDWETDVFSDLSEYSLKTNSADAQSIFDNTDIFNQERIYEMTLSFWFKRDDQSGIDSVIMTRNDTNTYGYYIKFLADGTMSIGYGWTSSFNDTIVNTSAIPLDKWVKIDWVYNHGVDKVYFNGVLDTTTDNSGSSLYITKGSLDLFIDSASTGTYGSFVDRIKIYDRVLTILEIKEQFISDPLFPYYNNDLLFSTRQQLDKNDAVFIENGLFGIHVSKQQSVEAKRSGGRCEFFYYDKGWESIGQPTVYSVANGDDVLNLLDFKILEITPLKQVIRVWFDGGESSSTLETYQQQSNNRGEKISMDIILEAGKFGATIIPNFDRQGDYHFRWVLSFISSVYMDIAIAGFEDIEIGELALDQTVSDADIPLALAFKKDKNLIMGFGTNKKADCRILGNATTDNIEFISFENVDTHVDRVFTVFAKKYYDPSDVDLDLFEEAESIGTPATVANSSGGASNNAVVFTSANTLTKSWTTLKKGSYIAWVRLYGTSTPTCSVIVEKTTTDIESYGYNIGSADLFTPGGSYTFYPVPFVVDDDTTNYDLDIVWGNGTINIDCLGIISLSNGKDGVMDLYHQLLSISNNKYIGKV